MVIAFRNELRVKISLKTFKYVHRSIPENFYLGFMSSSRSFFMYLAAVKHSFALSVCI
jgi:hypothetical protein